MLSRVGREMLQAAIVPPGAYKTLSAKWRASRTGEPLPIPAPFPVGARVRNADGLVVTIVRVFDGMQGTGEKMYDEDGMMQGVDGAPLKDVTMDGYSMYVNEAVAHVSKVDDNTNGRNVIICARDAKYWERVA